MKKISLIGLEYDEKSSYLKGTALAPEKIRSCLYSPASNTHSENGLDILHDLVVDNGNFKPREYLEIEEIVADQMKINDRILTLGGDHSITYPVIRAYNKIYPEIQILQFDAHGDIYDEFEGDRYSHACPFARIMEDGLAARLVQIGVRSLTRHQRDQMGKFGVTAVEMKDLNMDQLPGFYKPLYLSIDLDVLDPAFAPGVSHPEAGGMTTRQLLAIIQGLRVPIIGADIVECNPTRDVRDLTSWVAAKLVREVLAKMLEY